MSFNGRHGQATTILKAEKRPSSISVLRRTNRLPQTLYEGRRCSASGSNWRKPDNFSRNFWIEAHPELPTVATDDFRGLTRHWLQIMTRPLGNSWQLTQPFSTHALMVLRFRFAILAASRILTCSVRAAQVWQVYCGISIRKENPAREDSLVCSPPLYHELYFAQLFACACQQVKRTMSVETHL